MKKYGILLGILGAAAVMLGCGGDTELGWVNKSGENITDIEWVDSSLNTDVSWGTTEYADNQETEVKIVSVINGYVECEVWDQTVNGGIGDYITANPKVGDLGGSDFAQLAEGSTNIYDLYALPAK